MKPDSGSNMQDIPKDFRDVLAELGRIEYEIATRKYFERERAKLLELWGDTGLSRPRQKVDTE